MAGPSYKSRPGDGSQQQQQQPTQPPAVATTENYVPSSQSIGIATGGLARGAGPGAAALLMAGGKLPISMVENENPSSIKNAARRRAQDWVIGKTIDTAAGYDPNNLKYNQYVNTTYSPSWDTGCEDKLSAYNRQLGTIPLGPDVSTYSQVNQPDAMMSNLGISFTQPLLPTIPEVRNGSNNDEDRIEFTEFDPLSVPQGLLESHENKSDPNAEVSRLDIYDPRLTGYGTSYRGYVDEMTGQPRFYYDDIEATTQYNYLTRNHIDWAPFGTTVGPSPYDDVSKCPSAMDVRQQANNMFANQTIFQRNDLQQRLMLKNSHREKQRRQAPISGMQTSNRGMTRSTY